MWVSQYDFLHFPPPTPPTQPEGNLFSILPPGPQSSAVVSIMMNDYCPRIALWYMHSLKAKGWSFHNGNLSVHHFECEANNGLFHVTERKQRHRPWNLIQYIIILIKLLSKYGCDVMNRNYSVVVYWDQLTPWFRIFQDRYQVLKTYTFGLTAFYGCVYRAKLFILNLHKKSPKSTGKAEFSLWLIMKAEATFLLCPHVILLINFYEHSGFNMNFNGHNVYILVHIDAWGHWRERAPKAKVEKNTDGEDVNEN